MNTRWSPLVTATDARVGPVGACGPNLTSLFSTVVFPQTKHAFFVKPIPKTRQIHISVKNSSNIACHETLIGIICDVKHSQIMALLDYAFQKCWPCFLMPISCKHEVVKTHKDNLFIIRPKHILAFTMLPPCWSRSLYPILVIHANNQCINMEPDYFSSSLDLVTMIWMGVKSRWPHHDQDI